MKAQLEGFHDQAGLASAQLFRPRTRIHAQRCGEWIGAATFKLEGGHHEVNVVAIKPETLAGLKLNKIFGREATLLGGERTL